MSSPALSDRDRDVIELAEVVPQGLQIGGVSPRNRRVLMSFEPPRARQNRERSEPYGGSVPCPPTRTLLVGYASAFRPRLHPRGHTVMNIQQTLELFGNGARAWNEWADGMLFEMRDLKDNNEWAEGSEYEWIVRSRSWHERATADFSQHVFEESADFTDFRFPGKADFRNATFNQYANFSDRRIPPHRHLSSRQSSRMKPNSSAQVSGKPLCSTRLGSWDRSSSTP